MSPRLAITGASGYVGSRLIGALHGTPLAIVRKEVAYLPDAEQVELDLHTDRAALTEAFSEATSVVHLAGHNEIVAAQEPDRALAETVLGAQHVTQAAVATGVRRLVYVSTVHVYGARMTPGARLDEETPPAPSSTYAIARLACEHLMAQASSSGIDVVVLRLSNAVGAPRDVAVNRWTLVASDLCRQAVRTGEMTLRSSGLQWRDFIALGDVCDAVLRCADPDGGIPAGTYNLAAGGSHTVRELAGVLQDRLEAHTGSRPVLHTAPAEADPPEAYTVDAGRLDRAGWRATATLVDAVDDLVTFCLDHEDELR